MSIGLFKKFQYNIRIKELLIQTNNYELINNNSDLFWGVNSNNTKGENTLGKLLMGIRGIFQSERNISIHLNNILKH